MTFEEAVRASSAAISASFRAGKGALSGAHGAQITSADPRRFSGSVNLDDALSADAIHRHSSRWDYGLGYCFTKHRERAIWIEVHTASTSEVQRVLEKLSWLQAFLKNEAPDLGAMTVGPEENVDPFVWLATTSGTHITPNSPQARQLSKAGLALPRRTLRMP